MAGGTFVDVETGKGKTYHGELTWYVLITCIVAAMGGLIFGYDIGISGGVTSMAPFLEKFFPAVYKKQLADSSTNQYCKFDDQGLTMFTSSLYLVAIIGSLSASKMSTRWGRKRSMFIGGATFLVGAGINAGAVHISMLIIGRMLLGFGVGSATQAVPLYLSEMAPYKYRGALNMGFQLSITIEGAAPKEATVRKWSGQKCPMWMLLVANVVNYFFAQIHGGWGWRLSLGGAAIPALIITIGAICLPETPNSLIEHGELEQAKTSLRRIRGVEDIDAEFDDLLEASVEAKKVEQPWSNLLKRKYRPHLVIALLIPSLQQLTGINVIMFYAPVLFKTIGFGSDAALMSAVITGCVNAGATLVSIYGVDKWGRRFLFLEGGAQMLITQVAITIAIALKFGVSGEPGELPKWYAILVVMFICIYVAGFAWSWGPLGWLVPSEIFPLEIRSSAQSIVVGMNMLFTFLIAQVFLTMLCHLKFGLFIFFAFWVVVMTIFVYFLLPETKNIPIEEMAQVWQQHRYWKRYVEPAASDAGLQMAAKPV